MGVQEFYKYQQTTLEKKIANLEKNSDYQIREIKSYTKLGFFYEFTSDSTKVLEIFAKCYSGLCQSVTQLKKNFGIWEIKSFADAIMLKLFNIETSPKQTYDRLRTHYSTFKQSAKEMNPGLEYLVNITITIGI